MHVTAITILLATGLSGTFGKWVILAIPFESAIFGLWWLDHAKTIRTMGRYLANTIEPSIDTLFSRPNVIAWERRIENPVENVGGMKRIVKGYQSVSDISFIWPSAVVLAICLLGGFVTSRIAFPEKLEYAYDQFFQLAPEFSAGKPLILFAAFGVGIWMFLRYMREYWSFGTLIRKQELRAEVANAITS